MGLDGLLNQDDYCYYICNYCEIAWVQNQVVGIIELH